ncbi:MAG: glycoside hydrolase family 16 protein, partial [Bacteroidota bacterium]
MPKIMLLLLIIGLCFANQSCTQEEEVPAIPTTPTAPSQPVTPKDWNNAILVWSDEFDGDAVDTSKWLFETGGHGWGNNERQNYTAGTNAMVSDGTLKIITTLENGRYKSSRLNSKEAFKYGRMEVRAKIPEHRGPGLWPAIWMLGENIQEAGWPLCGELDLMEYVSFDPGKVHQTIHSEANNHTKGTQISSGAQPLPTIEEEFHTYGLLWDETTLRFYIDDIENVMLRFNQPTARSQGNWPFDQPFYFLLNTA